MCSGRISVAVRPSARSPVSRIMVRMARFSSAFSAALMSLPQAARSSSVKSSSLTAAFSSSTLAMRCCLSASFSAAAISS